MLIMPEVKTFISSTQAEKFPAEEVESEHSYWISERSLAAQVKKLGEIFGRDFFLPDEARSYVYEVPKNADGMFAIPRWESIASTYGDAVEMLIAILEKQLFGGKFLITREPHMLQESERTRRALEAISSEQKDFQILFVPAQLGVLHRGRSVRRVRELLGPDEFGLGVFQAGCILLTHPERFNEYKNLFLDCAGDECLPDEGENGFASSPVFDLDKQGRMVSLYGIRNSQYHRHCGSATGFISRPIRNFGVIHQTDNPNLFQKIL